MRPGSVRRAIETVNGDDAVVGLVGDGYGWTGHVLEGEDLVTRSRLLRIRVEDFEAEHVRSVWHGRAICNRLRRVWL